MLASNDCICPHKMQSLGFLPARNYMKILEGSQMEKLRADGQVRLVDDEQADIHEEGSAEREIGPLGKG
jgi:hypothetical protein